MTTSLHPLHTQVEPFGRTVGRPGAVVVQDLPAPAFERLAERSDLFDLVSQAADDGLVEKDPSFSHVVGEVDVAHRLLGQPRAQGLVMGIAHPQSHNMRSWPRSSSRSAPESNRLRIR